nr:reverse transcriptase domain-containing protein [Tanacetum cinerariifolium]
MEVSIGGLPQSIEGNVTASKPQTLEEAITITQRLMNQVIKHNSVQETSHHKQKFDDRRNYNNYQNNYNNYHHQQQNRRHEIVKAYAATPTVNSGYARDFPLCKRCNLHHTGPCPVQCQMVMDIQKQDKNKAKTDKIEHEMEEREKSKSNKFVRDPNKTPDLSQRPPHNCLKCENPVDGLYCRQCALLRKKLKEVWFTIYKENENFQDFLNTFESSNDNTNVVNASQEPFVFNQDPGKNSSQSPPHIDHHCCYGCGDSLDGIFCHQCTCESYGNGVHYDYNCLPKVSMISNPEPCPNQHVDEFPQTLPSFHPTCYSGDENSFADDSTPNFVDDSPNIFNPPPQPLTDSYEFCGNDAHYSHDCPPQVPIIYNLKPIAITPEEPVDSLIMKDKHLDTILAMESVKVSVEDLVPIPSESEGIPDNMCELKQAIYVYSPGELGKQASYGTFSGELCDSLGNL